MVHIVTTAISTIKTRSHLHRQANLGIQLWLQVNSLSEENTPFFNVKYSTRNYQYITTVSQRGHFSSPSIYIPTYVLQLNTMSEKIFGFLQR
jgi:hypothetical protein